MKIVRALDCILGVALFYVAWLYAWRGEWDVATFCMIAATNFELGYWMGK